MGYQSSELTSLLRIKKKNIQYLIVYKLDSLISHFNSFFVGESLPAKKKVRH